MKQRIKLPPSKGSLVLPIKFCIVCGKSQGADVRAFEHREANATAEFSKLIGDVSVFADYLLNTTLSIEAPFVGGVMVDFYLLRNVRNYFTSDFC